MFAAETGIGSHPALLAEAAKWSAGEYASVAEGAARLSNITADAGPCFQHPYYGIKGTHLQPTELRRLATPLAVLEEAAAALANRAESIADYLGVGQETSLASCAMIVSILQDIEALPADAAEVAEVVARQKPSRILEAAQSGIAWNDLKSVHSETFIDAAWNTPAVPLRLSLASGLSLFGRFGTAYRQGSKLLATLIKVPLVSVRTAAAAKFSDAEKGAGAHRASREADRGREGARGSQDGRRRDGCHDPCPLARRKDRLCDYGAA